MSGNWNNTGYPYQAPMQGYDETTRAIMDIETKKRTITQASNNEQNAIMQKVQEQYRKIGETAYSLYKGDKLDAKKLTELLDVVKGYFEEIEEKKKKLSEILDRYDEELSILRPAPGEGQAACPACNTIYNIGEVVFCKKCGNRLTDAQGSAADTSNAARCPNCNEPIVPGAVFCAGCGNKL